jgi:outer membrane protein TolC
MYFYGVELKKKIVLILAILLLNICCPNVFAQDALNQSVSTNEFLPYTIPFQTAIQCSLKNNSSIKAYRNHLRATEKNIGIAKSEFMPHAKFREDFEATNNPIEAFTIKLNQTRASAKDLAFGTLDYPGATLNFLTSLIAEQTFFDKKSMVAIKIAKKEYSATECLYVRKKEELVHKVAQACLKINTDKEIVKVVEEGIKDAKEHLAIAQDRYNKKKGLISDVFRAQSALEEREQRLISANTNLEVAKKHLGLLLSTESPVEISDSVPEVKLNKDVTYYQHLAAFRSDIIAMEKRVENAGNTVKYEQADWYPTLKAVASYNFYDPYYPFGGLGNNYIAGAFLKWDIFDGNKRKYEIEKAKYEEAEAREHLNGFKKDVNFQVYEIYTNVVEHQKNLEYAISRKKAAEESQVRIEKSWSESVLPFVAVIDSQDNLDRARLNLVNNQYDIQEDAITLLYESGLIYQTFAIE